MSYKVEPLELKIGKGVNIECCGRSYSHINCRDGFSLRVFGDNINYQGILFRHLDFQDLEFLLFRDVLDRLTQVSGEKTDEFDYLTYKDSIAYNNFEKKLGSIGSKIRLNTTDLKEFPKKAKLLLKNINTNKGDLRDLNFVFDKFLKTYENLKGIKDKVDDTKKLTNLSKILDIYFGAIEELFQHTLFQRGFLIFYSNPDKQKVLDLFGYILEKP